ncbi:MAG: sigma-70 family RNA polymerase sigma factor [Kofleriaceae bacterium]
MNDLNESRPSSADRSYVLAIVMRIVRDDDVAGDVTQDALLLAHRHRDQFRGDSAYRTWLHRIAVTSALQHLRKRRRSREQLVSTEEGARLFDVADPRPTPEQALAGRELAGVVGQVLDDVGPHRDVFELRMQDWSEPEIARRVGISVANVKIRAYRTRQRLRDALRDYTAAA